MQLNSPFESYVLSALAAGVVIVVLAFAAAKLRMRLLWFAAIGLAGVASGMVYISAA